MSNRSRLAVVAVVLVSAVGCADPDAPPDEIEKVISAVQSPDVAPTGRGIGTLNRFQKGEAGKPRPGTDGNGIIYHGGPVMLGRGEGLLHLVRRLGSNSAPAIPPGSGGEHRRVAVLTTSTPATPAAPAWR
jgi:hypothetical protein